MADENEVICQLCKRNKANNKNSHIVPAFWLKSQIGERNEEKAYLITEEPKQDYKKDIGAEGLAEDHILCSDCEKRLGYVESYFSAEIIQKIEDKKFTANFQRQQSKHGDLLECKRVNPIAFHLLIYSIIWRAAISRQPVYSHFTLPEDVLEDLRFTLDLFLPNTINHQVEIKQDKWLKTLENCQDLFSFFPYVILKADSLPDKTETIDWFDNASNSPNHIILNEYIILPFFQCMEWKEEDDFFELKNEIDLMGLLNNCYEDVKIGIISNEKYAAIVDKIYKKTAQKRNVRSDSRSFAELVLEGKISIADAIGQIVQRNQDT